MSLLLLLLLLFGERVVLVFVVECCFIDLVSGEALVEKGERGSKISWFPFLTPQFSISFDISILSDSRILDRLIGIFKNAAFSLVLMVTKSRPYLLKHN